MYLKSLELMGFKSFGRKTIFEFHPGITAIIGPNGSGKSNVCDAIRWVLGEQSAKALRGTKMAEVIFAGSSEHRPAAFSQVKLLLDNEDRALPIDYSEVSIGRQLFRSGESNYYFNNDRTLLADIKESLMDTGIGKDGYSIIGQGDISDIISQRLSSRRSLIEEAAGITKFKHRKAHTLQKLDHTKTNITRLRDLIHEIEGSLAPLAEQAEKTRKYQGLSQEIRTLEIDLILFDLAQYYNDFDNYDSMRRGLQAKLAEIQTFMSEIGGKKAEIRSHILAMEANVKEEQERVRINQQAVEEIRTSISARKENSRSFQARREAILEEISRIDHQVLTSEDERRDAENRLRDEDALEISIQGRMVEIEENLKKVQVELDTHIQSVSQDRTSSFQVGSLMVEKKNIINGAQQQMQMLQRQLEKSSVDAESIHSQVTKFTTEKERLEKDIAVMEGEILQSDTALNDERGRFGHAERGLTRSEEELASLDDQIKMHQARRNLLEELKNRTDAGMPRGACAALAMKQSELPNIFGVVGELLTVKRGFEVAFETALGASIHDVVVKDADTAQKAINALKDRKAGRATFLPLDLIQAGARLENPKSKGCLGVALDLIEFEPRYYHVMNYLLGRILIFERLDDAVAYSRLNRNFNRLITLEGDVVRSSGAMTGGSEGQKTGGMLSRKRELEDLEEKLKSCQSQEKRLISQIASLRKERNALMASIRQREDFVTRRRQSLDFFRGSLQKTLGDLDSKMAEEKNMETDRAEMQKEFNRLGQDMKNAQEELARLESQNSELALRIQALTGKEEAIQVRLNSLKSLQNDERVSLSAVAERKRSCKKEMEAAEKRRQSSAERKERAQADVEQLAQALAEAEKQIHEELKRQEELENKRQELEKSVLVVQEEYHQASRELESLDHTYASRAKIEDSTKNKLSEMDVKVAEIKTHIQNKEGILSGEYGFQIDESTRTVRKHENREAIFLLLTERKIQREALEPVNPLAIEDYEKAKERFDFLNSQVADLSDAASSLEQVITEIEKISLERFSETFTRINSAFVEIFKILFPGGHGLLRLAEPEKALESNIDIVCQLPGKRLTTLELFSGGEQTLISIALLFSILQVKPPAFCLLDEAEAALDEANVKRFTRLLRSFADKTQFLVITHNKETMQAVDVIYGITLEKSGVSRQISIRLEDQDKITEFTIGKQRHAAPATASASA